MKNYFKVIESSSYPGKYLIFLDFERLPSNFYFRKGSYEVLNARLLGINFADYLRLCRDEFGAEIVGKTSTYPVAFFPTILKANDLIKILNKKMVKFLEVYSANYS